MKFILIFKIKTFFAIVIQSNEIFIVKCLRSNMLVIVSKRGGKSRGSFEPAKTQRFTSATI